MRKQEMGSSPNKGRSSRKTAYCAGAGLVIGAGVGMTVDLLLFENLVLGAGIGAGVGLVIGAAMDAQMCHGADSDQ